MATVNSCFVIINPSSGNGSAKRKWPLIEKLLKDYDFEFSHGFTEYPRHGVELAQRAIIQGFTQIICVGGDGTIHNIVNGIMRQKIRPSIDLKLGVIPIGTGNDWIKTHGIPRDPEKAVQCIKNRNIMTQDIGKIEFQNQELKPVFFNNLAGIGFDGFVVNKIEKFKHFGAAAYLIAAFISMFQFKNFKAHISYNTQTVSSKVLMVLAGLCRYSGGGMQLTNTPDPADGLLDLSIAKDFTKLDLLRNMFKLFNGSITESNKVITAKAKEITIEVEAGGSPHLQADGELIGGGNFSVRIIPMALCFYA